MAEARPRCGEVVGWGMSVPERVLSNDDLAAMVDTSDQWIRSRTGISTRRVAGAGETTATLATQAARNALEVADADPRDVDLILVATSTPDHPMPSTACLVQNALGAIHAGAVDLNAGCSGFVYGLVMGHQAIASGEHDLVLVIGADTMSRVVDWGDRSTCVLFGDGAGAVLLRPSHGDGGVLGTILGADGAGAELLRIPAGGSALPASGETVAKRQHFLGMDGRQVYRFATRVLPESIRQVAAKSGLALDEIDWVIPHQANMRIIETAAKRCKMPTERFYLNLERFGNTSAASVPIAMCEALEQGCIQDGDNVLLVGFGAGLTWAAAALRWAPEAEEHRGAWLHRWLRNLLYSWARARTRLRHLYNTTFVRLIRWTQRSE